MKNNTRKALKRKARRKEMIERRRDDELYELSKIEKNTWEGQTRLPIDEISPINSEIDNKNSWWSYLGF